MLSRILLLFMLLCSAGCPLPDETLPPLAPAEPTEPLRVVVVDDRPLAEAIEREWTARTGKSIEVHQQTEAKFLADTDWQADVVIYPPGLMGTLVENGRIIPFPEETLHTEAFDRRDLLPLTRQYEMRWAGQTYGVALSAPRLALLYRSDLLEELSATPPTTWEAYASLAAQLSDRAKLGELAPDEDRPWSGTVEPWADQWLSEMLLARVASSIRRQGHLSTLFDYASMQSQLDSPPVRESLQNMQNVMPHQPVEPLAIDPAEARRRILAGECGMALTWLPTAYDPQQADAISADAPPLGIASLPGSGRVYQEEKQQWIEREEGVESIPLVGFAGRQGSVAANATQRRAAFDLLLLIGGPEWSVDVTRRSVQAHPFRRKHVQQADAWLPPGTDPELRVRFKEYIERVESSPLVMLSPRLPGRPRYLAALDAAVKRCVIGEATPQEAAAEVNFQWNAITEELGEEQQRRAYRESAGIGL